MARQGEDVRVFVVQGRDPSSLSDLVYVVAVQDRQALKQACQRIGIKAPSGKAHANVKPRPLAGQEVALSDPGHFFWKDTDDLHDVEVAWRDEVALEQHRQAAKTRRLSAGRWTEPVQRK